MALAHKFHRRIRNALLFLQLVLLFFLQRRIEKRASPRSQSTAMCPLKQTTLFKIIKVLADRYAGDPELLRQIRNENATLTMNRRQHMLPTLFYEHRAVIDCALCRLCFHCYS